MPIYAVICLPIASVTHSPNAILKVRSPCETKRSCASGIYRDVFSFNRVYWSCKLFYISQPQFSVIYQLVVALRRHIGICMSRYIAHARSIYELCRSCDASICISDVDINRIFLYSGTRIPKYQDNFRSTQASRYPIILSTQY